MDGELGVSRHGDEELCDPLVGELTERFRGELDFSLLNFYHGGDFTN
jgi:hypothetical protein